MTFRDSLFALALLAAGATSCADRPARQMMLYSADNSLRLAELTPQGWQFMRSVASSDYGQWGTEKRMASPASVVRNARGEWLAVWSVNDKAPTFAAAWSNDMVFWRPQDYPRMPQGPCLDAAVALEGDSAAVYYHNGQGQYFRSPASADFRRFYTPVACDKPQLAQAQTFMLTDSTEFSTGYLFNVEADLCDFAKAFCDAEAAKTESYKETLYDDSAKLLPQLRLLQTSDGTSFVEATVNVDASKPKDISDKLIGVFFEDINYAADGGLYAEMVQNRDFEYDGERKGWGPATAWKVAKGALDIRTENPLSEVNSHYLVLGRTPVFNEGWDGFVYKRGEVYYFNVYARVLGSAPARLSVSLCAQDKSAADSKTITIEGGEWKNYEVELTSGADVADGLLQISATADVAVDMVSLFPKDTYKGRRNGLRRDLAEAIAALHPRFVRFPGGCMSHGQGIDNIYHWGETVGPLHERKPAPNIWHSHQTRGLGFYEFFCWCEDMGAEPLPVLAAGVPCQNSAADATGMGGQQGGIPMEQMEAYCQEFVNLIEWANGDPATNEWAKMRADAGHPEPFNLKMVGVGNEDLISTTFEERYLMIAKYIKQRFPSMQICGTAGPFHAPSSDYVEGWLFAREHQDVTDLVDEHYYESAGWYLNNQHYYDKYDRNHPKVYLGEYSENSHRVSTVESALCEALHLCNVERNADVVVMTSYAPLLCNSLHRNWNPDMIYFQKGDAPFFTPSYHTQRLFGSNAGNVYVPTTVQADAPVAHRLVASTVRDSRSGAERLKIVNALPVAAKVKVPALKAGETYAFEALGGRPDAHSANLTEGRLTVEADQTIMLPAYTFAVIKVAE